MIETVIVTASLVVLGYAFYMSSRTLWAFKSEKGIWRWLYALVSGFIFFTFFLMGIVLFSFLLSPFISQTIASFLNIVIGIFFLSSAGLIGAVIRYHLSVMGMQAADAVKKDLKKKGMDKEASRIEEHIENPKNAPGGAGMVKRITATNEIRMIELRNKIRRLQRK